MGMGYALALLITMLVAAPVIWVAWWVMADLSGTPPTPYNGWRGRFGRV